jgi:putative transposase
MTCPHCKSTVTTERSDRTALGYRRFRCRACRRGFNERTGTLFNYLEYPTDIVCLVVFWRFRYKLSLRDLAEMFLQRGVGFTHEAVREWEAKLAPLLSDSLRKRRSGAVGNSWYVDETYIKVQGTWQYLYRALDRDGNLIDARLSDTRDLAAAEAFFRSAWTVFGDGVTHRTNRYLNNHVEQDHRGIKQRYRPMCGFKHGQSAARFCRLFDEIRAFLRPQSQRNQSLSLAQRRRIHQDRFAQLIGVMAAV